MKLFNIEKLFGAIKAAFDLSRVVRWNAHRKGMWYCPTCNMAVPGNDVTFLETHDVRVGGCGESVY